MSFELKGHLLAFQPSVEKPAPLMVYSALMCMEATHSISGKPPQMLKNQGFGAEYACILSSIFM